PAGPDLDAKFGHSDAQVHLPGLGVSETQGPLPGRPASDHVDVSSLVDQSVQHQHCAGMHRPVPLRQRQPCKRLHHLGLVHVNASLVHDDGDRLSFIGLSGERSTVRRMSPSRKVPFQSLKTTAVALTALLASPAWAQSEPMALPDLFGKETWSLV